MSTVFTSLPVYQGKEFFAGAEAETEQTSCIGHGAQHLFTTNSVQQEGIV